MAPVHPGSSAYRWRLFTRWGNQVLANAYLRMPHRVRSTMRLYSIPGNTREPVLPMEQYTLIVLQSSISIHAELIMYSNTCSPRYSCCNARLHVYHDCCCFRNWLVAEAIPGRRKLAPKRIHALTPAFYLQDEQRSQAQRLLERERVDETQVPGSVAERALSAPTRHAAAGWTLPEGPVKR
jgi:hypothetical protein